MNKQYRAELKILAQARKKICRDFSKHNLALDRQINRLQKERFRAGQRANRATEKIDRRIAILQGRLS